MAGRVNYKKRVKKLVDCIDYFVDDEEVSMEDAAHRIATWLFDRNFDFDESSYEDLKKIRKVVPELEYLILENMFLRNHDT